MKASTSILEESGASKKSVMTFIVTTREQTKLKVTLDCRYLSNPTMVLISHLGLKSRTSNHGSKSRLHNCITTTLLTAMLGNDSHASSTFPKKVVQRPLKRSQVPNCTQDLKPYLQLNVSTIELQFTSSQVAGHHICSAMWEKILLNELVRFGMLCYGLIYKV